jgi:hypothetical protein
MTLILRTWPGAAISILLALGGCATLGSEPASAAPLSRDEPRYDGTCGNLSDVVHVIYAEGRIVDTWASRCDLEADKGVAAAKELASRDLACATSEIAAEVSAVDSVVVIAEGCGRRAAYYYALVGYDSSRAIPGYEGREVEGRIHFLTRLTPERAPAALAAVNAFVARTRSRPVSNLLALYVSLLQSASRDLRCATDELVPELVYVSGSVRTPVVEGCGVRATWLPINIGKAVYVLSALLPLDALSRRH